MYLYPDTVEHLGSCPDFPASRNNPGLEFARTRPTNLSINLSTNFSPRFMTVPDSAVPHRTSPLCPRTQSDPNSSPGQRQKPSTRLRLRDGHWGGGLDVGLEVLARDGIPVVAPDEMHVEVWGFLLLRPDHALELVHALVLHTQTSTFRLQRRHGQAHSPDRARP